MTFLLDVNVLLAILHAEHAHAENANVWLARHGNLGNIAVCRITQMGVLRLLTKRSVMGEKVLSGADAWIYWEELERDVRFTYLNEPPHLDRIWRSLCERLQSGAAVDTDTYLAAFAQAAELTLVTFDGGFRRFPNLRLELLGP